MGQLSLLLLLPGLSSFSNTGGSYRLVFEEEQSMRSSFCMYSDGKFYEASSSGCVGQDFAYGSWQMNHDTVTLIYHTDNVFDLEILQSAGTESNFQVVRILDCYNQPVRFQNMRFDTTWQNLYNPGMASIKKGQSIFYAAPLYDLNNNNAAPVCFSADTVTYKWHCNRESIESIDGGRLYVHQEAGKKTIILKNRKVWRLP